MSDPTLPAAAPPVCRNHPDRVSYIRCQRCGNPICPECQRSAAVGVQCAQCVQSAAASMPSQRSVVGGSVALGTPVVTIGFMAICGLVFLGQLAVPGFDSKVALSSAAGEREPWRLITSAFAHGGVLHIAFNMYALWIMGNALEPMLGRARYLALLLLSALGGSIGFLLSQPTGATQGVVGASGAVFGLFLAYVIIARGLGREIGGMGAIIALNLALPFFLPNIAWQAHIGGAITGALVAGAIMLGRRQGNQRVVWAGMAGIFVLLVILYFVHYAG